MTLRKSFPRELIFPFSWIEKNYYGKWDSDHFLSFNPEPLKQFCVSFCVKLMTSQYKGIILYGQLWKISVTTLIIIVDLLILARLHNSLTSCFKDTCYVWAKMSKKDNLGDVLLDNFVNKSYRFLKDGLLTKLTSKMSREASCQDMLDQSQMPINEDQ